ncbi:MAG: site-specific DNA-methyltransferase [Tannerellaceae bacterium]|nr:site-specific DNA-methyltransferase [Tannerellaceae bacterium]
MTDKLDLKSPDMVNENFEKLAELFPNCVTEGATGREIDFDQLRQELSHAVVEGNKERYRLEWPGKREAIVTANLPTTKTLRPVREDSVDFDNTENLYIEGDNLEVLKLLQESYLGKIKMIYIDPPYNTGKDFVYKDNFSKDKQEELVESGQKDEYNQRLVANPETAGRYHSDWLSMMYPRLKLARNLLTDDGVIFISIDDHEIENLIKIGNEIFGDINLMGPMIQNKLNSKNDTVNIQRNHEYVVAYRKRTEFITNTKIKPNLINKAWKEKTVYEENGEYYYLNDPITTRGEGGTLNKRHNLGYTIYYNPKTSEFVPEEDYDKELAKTSNSEEMVYSTIEEYLDRGFVPVRPPMVRGKLGCWTWSLNKTTEEKKNLIVTGKNGSYTLRKRTFIPKEEVIEEGGKLLYRYHSEGNSRSILEFSTNEGTTVLNELMGFQGAFDNPKNVEMLQYFINLITDKDFIILDFFSGSASSAHSVLKANSFDRGTRKFIQVQLPEELEEDHEARQHGYTNICQLGKERIRRAAKKIKEETGADIDYGFRVYRIDSSNMQDVYYKPQDYVQNNLDLFADNVKPDRTADDLLAQVMLDWGLSLSLKIEQAEVSGKKVFKVAENSLYACFDNGIDEDFAKAIAADAPLRIVFKDSGFKNDTAKVNVKQLLKQLSPETEMKVI